MVVGGTPQHYRVLVFLIRLFQKGNAGKFVHLIILHFFADNFSILSGADPIQDLLCAELVLFNEINFKNNRLQGQFVVGRDKEYPD